MNPTKVMVLLLLLLVVVVCIPRHSGGRGYLEIMRRDGVLHIHHSIDRRTLEYIHTGILHQLAAHGKRGTINQASNRRIDLAVRLTAPVRHLIRDVWARYGHVWTRYLETENPRMVECSTLITLPGAAGQDWHRDVQARKGAKMVTIGIALQDITPLMAPLYVVKGTHRKLQHVSDRQEQDFGQHMTCRCGDIVAWDARVHHRGSRHASTRARSVLYFTIVSDHSLPKGPTHTILPEYTKPYVRMNDL